MGYLIYSTARLLRRVADSRLKPLGLSSAHLPVITALMEHTKLSQKSLAELVGIEQPTMAATLARMERDGIVERRPDPFDGRSALISLTPRAVKQLPTIEQVVRTINHDALRDLSDDRRNDFRQTMLTIIASLEATMGDDSRTAD